MDNVTALTDEEIALALATLSQDVKRVFSLIDVSLLTGKSTRQLIAWITSGMIRPTYRTAPFITRSPQPVSPSGNSPSPASIQEKGATANGAKKEVRRETFYNYLFDFNDLVAVIIVSCLHDYAPEFVFSLHEALINNTDDADAIRDWLQKEIAKSREYLLKDIAD